MATRTGPDRGEEEEEEEYKYPDHELRCGSCGYKWDYSGEMWRATCPRCGGKVRTEHYGR